jgi:hypothetical protein
MRDSIQNESNRKNLTSMQLQYQYEKKTLADSLKTAGEKKIHEARLAQERTQKYALYLGLFITLVFAVFIFQRFTVTRKQKNIIEDQKKDVEQKKNEIEFQKHLVEEKQKEIIDSMPKGSKKRFWQAKRC